VGIGRRIAVCGYLIREGAARGQIIAAGMDEKEIKTSR
jgi:hypothetical protein